MLDLRNILSQIEFPWPVSQVALQHHERINGSGYPFGRRGKELLLESRIVAVADAVEAMSSQRHYRDPLGIGEALEEITLNRGVLYDGHVVDACV
jgi:HD-GYP domain-containing protein (c-di-GMP phosphodiesterase class II)